MSEESKTQQINMAVEDADEARLAALQAEHAAEDAEKAAEAAAVDARVALEKFEAAEEAAEQKQAALAAENAAQLKSLETEKTIRATMAGIVSDKSAAADFTRAEAVATEAADRLRTTGDSHMRCMVLEVMGRHAGWIAMYAGVAAGAHAILIPEAPETLEQICKWVNAVKDRRRAPLIIVAEGFTFPDMDAAFSHRGLDEFNRPRLGGIGEILAPLIEERTGITTRATVLGHIQRGGVPTAFDRVLGTRFGQAISDTLADGDFGKMVALRGTQVIRVPFSDAVGHSKNVYAEFYNGARALFG